MDAPGPGAMHVDATRVCVRGENEGLCQVALVIPVDVDGADAVVTSGFSSRDVLVECAAGANAAG